MRPALPALFCALLTASACGDDSGTSEPMADGEASTSSADPEATEAEPTGTAPDDADSTGATADGSDDGASDDTTGEPDDGAVEVDMAWLDDIEGQWLGGVDGTPIGNIPQFFLDFAWEGDGSLHTYVDDGQGASFDFRFFQEDGQWVFFEEGTLPGGLTQSYELVPVEVNGNRVRWVTPMAPDYLAVEIEVDDERFQMDVSVLGRSHAAFDLSRL